MDKKCWDCGLGEEVEKLKEENESLKEDLQKLRLELYGLKASRKRKRDSAETQGKSKGKKLGPPNGHRGTSRAKPEEVDRKIVLRLDSCPHCSRNIKPLKPRYRYAEERIMPAELLATEYEINQYYCRDCKKVVYPEVPWFIDNCHFGVRFLLYIIYLRYVMNLPYNKIVKLLNDTYQAGVSRGYVGKLHQEGGRNTLARSMGG